MSLPEYETINPGDKVAVAISYDGSAYHGWQSQLKPQVPTVQEGLEQALSFVANGPIKVHCAGRTDSGVHASHQLVHFESPVARSEKAWVQGGNTRLPAGIAIHWAKPVAEDFHARFSATARRYRYVILNDTVRPALLANGVTFASRPLNAERMHAEAQCLLGELDFTSFRAVACQANSPMRNVHFIRVYRRQQLVIIDIQANAFLYHMVRNIAGALMDVGVGKQPAGWLHEILLAKDRSLSSATASPKGLYLVDVAYPQHFNLPPVAVGPYFVPAD
ncbi:tRNA pseudouridine(38-40) synthase TruA [Dasania marina]|uniref:tRNA pseudouridine(38-40) synthase TruA n=1 Tax=Dasania marina TaxID=471499 RepID=UPI0030DCCD03|tara:strand:- start:15179 stop:16009 length:831 start_codon:yes stop_codon:yes gene_type:complete